MSEKEKKKISENKEIDKKKVNNKPKSKKAKDKKSKKKKENDSVNIIIGVTTAILVVAVICLSIVLWKTTPANEDSGTTVPQSDHETTPAEMIKTYETTETGSVSEADSKVYAYFKSHFQDDYYRVNEISYSVVAEGNYTEYYETETVAYSTQGYLYRKKTQSSYEEQDYASPIVEIYTPEKSYLVYTDTKSYFEGTQTTQNYENKIDFPGDTFKTGKININGRMYDYEETSDDDGITYRYCFDENGRLAYNIASSSNGTITTRYIEYSKNVDYSLFKVPEDYMLVSN